VVHDSNANTSYTPGLAHRQGSADRFYHSDWLGSTRFLSDGTGIDFPSALRYDAFGRRSATGGVDPYHPSDFQFAGAWGYQTEYATAADPGLGLQYLQQRYYDPAIGRFISPDPIGFAGGLNLYAYAGGNPVGNVDPSGEDWEGAKKWAGQAWDTATHAVSRGLLRLFYTPPGPEMKTFNDANDFYRPHLKRAGKEIHDFIDDQMADITNNLIFAGIGARGAKAACEAAVGAEVRFRQRGISAMFKHGEFAGKSIDEVAAGLRAGTISPDKLPIQVIVRDGVTYTINNRSLMALRMADKQPTMIINVTGDPFFESQLTARLREIGSKMQPGFVPRVRGGGK